MRPLVFLSITPLFKFICLEKQSFEFIILSNYYKKPQKYDT